MEHRTLLPVAVPVPTGPMMYRIEVEDHGVRRAWALVAPDVIEAARLASQAAGPGNRVVAISPVGELL